MINEDISLYESELSECVDSLSKLRAQRDLRELRNAKLGEIVGSAKLRVSRQPKMQEFLEKLQEITHQKTVGLYEELLSAVVQDVLPGTKNVSLELKTLRGLPSLDIEMMTEGGNKESILDGSGGALTNILSAGLRVIALSRSGAYPFLVLDEPDCWLKPSRVPQFASVISQIAKDLKIQVLLISHHDSELFSKFAPQVILEKRGGVIDARWASEIIPDWSGSTTGIKEITLTNFMSHKKTKIPLSPGVTCLTGENDIGKSAVVSAFRALFHGNSKDSAIFHGASEFEVSTTFFDNSRISLTRYAKKSPKQRWRLYLKGIEEAVQDSSPKDGVPEWLSHIANMARTDDLDIAFANQKSPVFLLNETPSRQATILAIGRESSHLQKLISKHKERCAIDGKLIRDGEYEGALISRELVLLSPIDDLGAKASHLRATAVTIKNDLITTDVFNEKLKRLSVLSKFLSLDSINAIGSFAPNARIEEIDDLHWKITHLVKLNKINNIVIPEFKHQDLIIIPHDNLLTKIESLHQKNKFIALNIPNAIRVNPSIEATENLFFNIEKLKKCLFLSTVKVPSKGLSTPRMELLDNLDDLNKKIRSLLRVNKFLKVPFFENIIGLAQPPSLEVIDKFGLSLELYKALSSDLSVLSKKSISCLNRLQKIDEKINILIKENGHQCPTCGGIIDVGQFKKIKCNHD